MSNDKNKNDKPVLNSNWVEYPDASLIRYDVKDTGVSGAQSYTKYVNYEAPNGKPIYILAQDKVTDEQLLKAYNVLDFYLDSLNSTEVTNSIANNKAVINMPNGADGDSSIPFWALTGQPLYQMETPTEGSKWYIENDYEHRDASYEEILHFVHDYGIGIQSSEQALPELQKRIYAATMNALPENKDDWGKKGLWGLGAKEWLNELSKEGSLEQEYLAAVVDSYYGQWGASSDSDNGMDGLYVAKTREDIMEQDNIGYELVTGMFPEYLTYMARIDSQFEGTFTMTFDPQIPYTHKSQYLLNARLLGSNDSNLVGNSQNNILIGNIGSNIIDGKEGYDVVQYNSYSSDYIIDFQETEIIVTENSTDQNTDTLKNIELLRFKDKDIQVN
ncbi:hypothetical protein V7O62_04990 [Methanolobus sp. ZRKC2]|uniref:hypothetical protein n=1 Tax=Methanolobus sp. ZRKC2 TaxID=3125783 RepID=UPI00324884D7